MTVPNQGPTANFTALSVDLSVTLTDTSVDSDGSVVGWSWDFGDGNSSDLQNPNHTYAAAGLYPVTLSVIDDDGASDSTSQPVAVTEPNQAPTAGFTALSTDLSVSLTDTSIDNDGTLVSWFWDFGDGNSSDLQNPIHTYTAGGALPGHPECDRR